MKTFKTLRTLTLAAALIAFVVPARATYDEQLQERRDLQDSIKRLEAGIAATKKGLNKRYDEANLEQIKYGEDLLKKLEKGLSQKQSKLKGVQTKIVASEAKFAKQRQEAEAKRQKALQEVESARTAKAKAEAEGKAKKEEAAKIAHATREPERTTNSTSRPLANVNDLKDIEKKHEQEALRAGQARSDALERFAKNPSPQNRAAYEAALKDMNTKVAELNTARHQTDKVSGESRKDTNVKSAHEVLERLKSQGRITTTHVEAMREVVRDASRSAVRDQGRTFAANAARDASRVASTGASKDSAKEANKSMSKSASQSAASSAAKPAPHPYP